MNKQLYILHSKEAHDGTKLYGKVFSKSVIQKYELSDTLQYNYDILGKECKSFAYPDYFNQIVAKKEEGDTQIYFTKKYQKRLNEYLGKGGPRKESEAIQILQDIFKSVYSLIIEGLFHLNLRSDHFVLADGKWKMDVLINTQENKSGETSEYLFNPEYNPPEAYVRNDFSNQQIDERVVWNLGCILIQILSGSHKLKDETIFRKFINNPFSFKSLGAKIDDKISPEMKQLLGKMCHYNEEKRMKFKQLINNKFLFTTVAKNHENNMKKVNSKISDSQSSIQQIQVLISNEQRVSAANLKKVHEQSEQEDFGKPSDNNSIEKSVRFHEKINSIIDSNQTVKLEEIKNNETNQMIDLYKNYLDQGEILRMGSLKFKEMIISLFDKNEKELGFSLVSLIDFALNFVRSMKLSILAKSLNENKMFFQASDNYWGAFQGSNQYYALKKIVNKRKEKSIKQIVQLRKKLLQSNNKFVFEKPIIEKFVTNSNPEQCKFEDIKEPYRKILKLSYDMVATHFSTHKTKEWGRVGMYITYCMAIDKLCIESKFKSNFKHFFQWSQKTPSNYVSLEQFQEYLQKAPTSTLVQNSKYILETYFQI